MTLLIALMPFSCRKVKIKEGNSRLPRATERGKRIFACYIDNRTYIARYQPRAVYNPENGYLHISCTIRSFEFRIFIYENFTGIGEYKLSETGEELYHSENNFYGVRTSGLNCFYISEFNLAEDIIAGTFQMDLYNSDSTEVKKIRNGIFDLEIEKI
ncbi:MAG: hypothetical protein AB8B72_08520 [Crocinitomicaceae bacterium]